MAEPADSQPPIGEVAAQVQRISEENARLFAQLAEGERRLRRLARAVWRVEEEERRRLSRELHDELGQVLTALRIKLEVLGSELGAGSGAQSGESAALELAGRALTETRQLSRLLRPSVLDDLGLGPALQWLARSQHESVGLTVELDCRGLDVRLDPELETVVFRVGQEALTNVTKHAGASGARVELALAGSRLALRVSDPGRGFDVARAARPTTGTGGGSGLRGMRDRVELFGGRLEVRSAPGAGTVVEAELPVELAAGPSAGSANPADPAGGGA